MVFGKFVRWLGGGKSTRDYIIDLKMVNKRLARSSKKLETERESKTLFRHYSLNYFTTIIH